MMAKKRGRKRTKDLYFGPEQEEAVVKYLSIGEVLELKDEEDKTFYVWSGTTKEKRERDKIYMDYLHEPINKMAESIIRRYGLYRKGYEFEDLHGDAISFLMMKANKFDINAGKKAYSYYGTIIKHYLLGLVQSDDKKLQRFASYEDNYEQINEDKRFSYEIEDESNGLDELIQDVIDKIQHELDENEANDFKDMNENQRRVGGALIDLLLHWDVILGDGMSDSKKYNKLAIYEMMRNLTGLNTKEIRKALTHYKDIYFIFKDDYIDNDLL